MPHDLANQALWVVFQHTGNSKMLAVPSIARDPERHWVLAWRGPQLLHQAAQKGPDDLVKSLWTKIKDHRGLLRKCITNGNLAMIQYIQKLTNMALDVSLEMFKTTLDLAVEAGHIGVIRFFLQHKWTLSSLQFALEKCFDVDAVKMFLETPGIYVHNALQNSMIARRYDIFELLLKQTRSKPRDELLREMGSGGHIKAYKCLCKRYDKIPFQVCMMILSRISEYGHARLCDMVLKRCKRDQPNKPISEQHDTFVQGTPRGPSVHSAQYSGYLRLAKVLLRHGFPDADMNLAAQSGYHTVVAHCLRKNIRSDELRNAMNSCALGTLSIKDCQSTLWHQSTNFDYEKTFELLLQRWLHRRPFDLFDIAIVAMKIDNNPIAKMVFPYLNEVRRDNYVLGAWAQSMTDLTIWQSLKSTQGDMTADEQEYHMMRNDREDGSIATSDIVLDQD